MPTITFLPAGITVEVRPGTTVFAAAARAEVPIASQCGGKCACALCRVKVVDGDGLISPMGWEEEGHMGNAFFLTRERLSCQTQVFGDVTIEVSAPEPKAAGKSRYVPFSLLKKREEMEREADRKEAVGAGRPPPAKGPRSASPAEGKPGPRKPRRKKPRNPGAPRRGDSRPPPGKKG